MTTAFVEHCRAVAKNFLRTVIVIDDQAKFITSIAELPVTADTPSVADEPYGALPVAVKVPAVSMIQPTALDSDSLGVLGAVQEAEGRVVSVQRTRVAVKAEAALERSDAEHSLNAQLLTSSFFVHGIIAGLYRPLVAETSDGAKLKETVAHAVNVAAKSDAVIIDWLLNGKDPTLAKEILASILIYDYSLGGRLRTIVVYTGEKDLTERRNELIGFLNAKRITSSNSNEYITFLPDGDFSISGPNLRIAFYSKSIDGNIVGAERVKLESELPEVLIDELLLYANGLLPSFALKAAAVLRDNTHHLLTRFPANLDGAYLAHRVLIPDADDSEPFMIDNFLSIIKNKLITEQVDKDMLGKSAISALMKGNSKVAVAIKNGVNDVELKFSDLEDSVISGKLAFESLISTSSGKRQDEKKLLEIASQLAAGDKYLHGFSVMTSFRRSFADMSGIETSHAPYLTQGTLLAKIVGEGSKLIYEYFLCITPKCDCVRIPPKALDFVRVPFKLQSYRRNFSFVRLEQDAKKYDVIADHGGQYKMLKTNPKFHEIEHIYFDADPALQRVMSSYDESLEGYAFQETSNTYLWIGDLKDLHMQSKVSTLVGNLNRVGYDEFDWLRQKAK